MKQMNLADISQVFLLFTPVSIKLLLTALQSKKMKKEEKKKGEKTVKKQKKATKVITYANFDV